MKTSSSHSTSPIVLALLAAIAGAACHQMAGANGDGPAQQGTGGGSAGSAGAVGLGSGGGSAGSGGAGGMEATGGHGCVSRPLGQWQLTSTVGEPPPQPGLSSDVVLWSGSALFVISDNTDGGKYEPCLDKWQPFPAYPNFNSLIVATTDGAYFISVAAGVPDVFSHFDFGTLAWRQLSLAGYPAAADRGGASAMVGSQLVRWGGVAMRSSPYDVLANSGASYDPTSDRWRAMSMAGAPSERVVDTNVVAAGARLFVWGGALTTGRTSSVMQGDPAAAALTSAPGLTCPNWEPDNCSYGDGALYDPVADRWTPVTQSGAPVARYGHVTAWTGTRVLVWGGFHYVVQSDGEISNADLTDGALYDPAANTWTPTAPAPALGRFATPYATWSGGLLYLREAFNPSSAVYTYDPSTDRWATAQPGPMMPARTDGPNGPTVVWTGSYWIAFGGTRNGPTPPNPCTGQTPLEGCDAPGPMQIPVAEAAVALPAP